MRLLDSVSQRRSPILLCTLLAATASVGWPQSFRVQDFGQVQTNSATPATVTLSFSFTGLSAAPAFSLVYGADFSLGSKSCTVAATTNCTLPVSFLPHFPGLRQDSLAVTNQSGTLLATVFLHGLGLGPQLALYPGRIATFAGNGNWNYVDAASPSAASFRNPTGIAVDPSGNLYIADSINQAIRRVSASTGAVTTVAGKGIPGNSGNGGLATAATLNNPTGVALDAAGNLYIADQGNNLIRKVTAATGIISTIAGGGISASGADGLGDGGLATNALLYGPADVAVDASGNLYIADAFHHRIRLVNASTGVITVVAGGGSAPGSDGIGDGGPATNAQLSDPSGVALDAAGNLYIADAGNCLVRKVDMSTGLISVLAGNRNSGYSGDGGSAVYASLSSPTGVRIDPAGNIYIADFGNNVIRQVQASGKISTIAGSGANGYAGDGNAPTAAALANPNGVTLDFSGSLYISDYSNNVIRRVSFAAPMTFPSQNVGAASPMEIVTASNIGNQNLIFSNVSIDANFQLQASGDPDCAASSSVAPGTSCSIAIVFTPTAAAALTGALHVTTNSLGAPGSSQAINLSGTGTGSLATAPKAVLNTPSLTFGNQGTWTTSAPQTVVLSNPGGSPTNISSIWLAGPASSDYRITTTCGSALAAGANCSVAVTFVPTAAGLRSATLSFADSVAGSPQTLALNGTAVAGSVSLSTPALVFSQNLGTSSAMQTVVFSNIGSNPISIGSILLSGANVTDFSLTTTCGSSLASGATCTASSTFTPGAAGARAASLTFTDDAASLSQTVTLSGTGLDIPTIPVSAGLRFIPVNPCRVADTRWPVGPFGGPIIAINSSRDFVVPNSGCGIPANAQAYSVNVTIVPSGAIGYLEIWPTAQPQPVASLLNSDGRVKANAAIVPAGSNGAITIYSSDPTHVIVDINGYFVPATDTTALAFYPLTPCRVADTRDPAYGGPSLTYGEVRNFPVTGRCGVPASAQAFSMNATAVPHGGIGLLTLFPAGQNQPSASTLNTGTTVVANAAIVPAGANGSIAVYSNNPVDVVLDIDGYFAPPASGGLSLFNLTPCRIYDSRFAGPAPHTPISGTVAIGVATSACAVPSVAQAYVLNATIIPSNTFSLLSLYPNGAPLPFSSTLNSDDLALVSNMAIIPTSNGIVNAFASSSMQLILDVYGYFAP
jgi:sugar lactone lactonase YvrE